MLRWGTRVCNFRTARLPWNQTFGLMSVEHEVMSKESIALTLLTGNRHMDWLSLVYYEFYINPFTSGTEAYTRFESCHSQICVYMCVSFHKYPH